MVYVLERLLAVLQKVSEQSEDGVDNDCATMLVDFTGQRPSSAVCSAKPGKAPRDTWPMDRGTSQEKEARVRHMKKKSTSQEKAARVRKKHHESGKRKHESGKSKARVRKKKSLS